MAGAVRGIKELNLAFALAGTRFLKEKRLLLRNLGEPVRVDAEMFARTTIPRIGIPWSRMRTGASVDLVYVAPVERGTRIPTRKRRNFAPLLYRRALGPALEKNRPMINAKIDQLIARLERAWNRG